MKSKIFKRAWELFRKYDISFSIALQKAWLDMKRHLLVEAFVRIPSKKQYKNKKDNAKLKIKELDNSKNFPNFLFRNIVNNSGAEKYYGVGKYNAD